MHITLVAGPGPIMDSSLPSNYARKKVKQELANARIDVVYQKMVKSTVTQVELEDGSIVQADRVILCLGNALQTQVVTNKWVDKDGIKVDEFLRVQGSRNVFSLGDVASTGLKKMFAW